MAKLKSMMKRVVRESVGRMADSSWSRPLIKRDREERRGAKRVAGPAKAARARTVLGGDRDDLGG